MANIKSKDKKPLHPLQMHIISVLIKNPKTSFGKLRPGDVPTDQFTYHLKQLIKQGLISLENGQYTLTRKGKRFAVHIDLTAKKKAEYSKRTVLIRVIRQTKNGFEWLVYQRLKQPYYGFVGFPAGKVFKNENPVDTAIRELKEETGLNMLAWRLIKIERDIILNSPTKIEDDFYLYTFDVYETSGELTPDPTEGEYFWASLEKIKQLDTFPGFFDAPEQTSWLTMPERFKQYLKLKKANKWQNFPPKFNKMRPQIISGQIFYEEWYLGDEGW